MVVIPCLAIIAPAFILCGVAAPVLGAVKLLDHVFKLGLPFLQSVGIVLPGSVQLAPATEFAWLIVLGVCLYFAGQGAWRLLVFYCKKVGSTKRELSV